ncbi:hypothetical protein FNF28_06903 [Cafeteria roenbergensis]|uniref:Uncharacterized protein n=1 Tax=Cafeteria roenbergensis TaxID=33653 RepID=A0A5A8CMM1_CAFRO|nr:hypothetical protein FNF28_06903 [Cafeteria roenbergensis]
MCGGRPGSAFTPGAAYEKSPEAEAGCCARVFFTWPNPIFVRGNAKVEGAKGEKVNYHLDEKDMFPLLPTDQADHLVSEFEKQYAENAKKMDANAVYTTLKNMYWGDFLILGVIKFFNSSLQFAPSILLNIFLENLELQTDGIAGNDPPEWQAYVLGLGLFLALSLRTLTENAYFHNGTRLAFRVRSALTTSIYRKSLRLSPAARQGTKEGSIVQLMNVDAERFNQVVPQLHVIWDGIYQILGYMTLLTVYIGASSFAGLGTMLLLIPVNVIIHGRLTKLRGSITTLTDARVHATNEALQGVRAIKLYGWERAFESNVAGIRSKELEKVSAAAHMNAWATTFMQSAPIIVAVVTLITYAAVSPVFRLSTVFTALTILTQLRFPLMFYPMILMLTSAASVSLGRMERFMAAPEVGADARSRSPSLHGEPSAAKDDAELASAQPAAAADALAATATRVEAAGAALANAPDAVIRMRKGTFWWSDPANPVVDLLEDKKAKAKAAKALADKEKKAHDKAASSGAAEAGVAKDGAATEVELAAATVQDLEAAPSQEVLACAVLDNVTFGVPRGKLLAVVGAVGSGKSALCSALLGELYRESGSSSVDGTVAFCAQRSWILNATVEKNITFAEEMDRKRYESVLKACQLETDLATLPGGDQCEIGERGVNLSGGQKQRVSVARAAYSGSGIVILDDVLSALDPEVGSRLFDECVLGLMAGRTRVMVTNQTHVLSKCDYIVELERGDDGKGRVARIGTFGELMEDPVFLERVETYAAAAAAAHAAELASKAEGADEEGASSPKAPAEPSSPVAVAASGAASPKAAEASGDAVAGAPDGKAAPGEAAKEAAAPKAADGSSQLTKAEEKEQGAVKLRFYTEWLRASSGSLWWALGAWLVFISLINQVGMLASNLWVSFWASDPFYALLPIGGYMGIFAGIGVASAVISMIRLLFFVRAGITASKTMHDTLFSSVIYAPMSFFDTTPLGRVMARFSKDMDAIDFNLSSQLGMLAMTLFLILGSLISIIIATPWFAVAILPIMVVYWMISQYFRNVSRECKRVDSVTRSPIYAHFGETLGGLSTIRAYGQAARFAGLNEKYVDANAAAWYTLRSCDRWLSVRLEILGNLIVLLSAVLAAASASAEADAGTVDQAGTLGIAALAGFALSYSLTITSVMNWAVRTLAETENLLNSVERVVLTGETTPQESRADPPVDDKWASAGSIEFSDVRMRYREDSPEVLHGVSFKINPGEKVGVVGRSGSGKSTIMQVIFRIPLDNCVSGKVLVDGKDTKEVGLHTLRQRLSIIPQECVMFSGDLRDNLDPARELRSACSTAEEADAKMVAALKDVGLYEVAMAKGGLGAEVSEFGENWSAGQRQLLSLARVLLRPTKILCLDEVSSSVDADTDKLMHETIHRRFSDRTVVTIAHRLDTIINSDRVLFVSAGRVMEFDHPHTLLQDPTSNFSAYVSEMGAAADGLRRRAKASWDARAAAAGAASPHA